MASARRAQQPGEEVADTARAPVGGRDRGGGTGRGPGETTASVPPLRHGVVRPVGRAPAAGGEVGRWRGACGGQVLFQRPPPEPTVRLSPQWALR
ncbi:MAG: hypothetical protein ACRDOO_10535, partial [Actinomadura sp.]